LPVKMFTYMASARPVLLAAGGEAQELLGQARAGLCIPPEDGNALAGAIVELMNNPKLCETLGRNGRYFVESDYSRETQGAQLARLLREVVGEKPGGAPL
jgi:glycosyltransferase involved in cell wall biosynthesis